ncbi:MAG: division/cell wall cluster transcriptional repressor MraZ [Dehalococcoidales bacterium]|jgi:MraZ protein
MFLGEFEYKVDEKGRVPVPPKFRAELKTGVVLAAGLESCITAYTIPEWKKISQGLTSAIPSRSKLRRLNRALFASAYNISLDGQGRIALPVSLRLRAGIEEEVIIIGANNYFELWDRQHWEEEKSLALEQAWQITESLEDR